MKYKHAMNENEHELGEAFEKAIKSVTRQLQVIDGTITAVDKTAYTCDVEVGDSFGTTTYHDVILRVLKNTQASVIEIPTVGAACTIYFTDGNLGRPRLFMVNESEELLVNCPQVVFNGGAQGGLPVTPSLVTRLNNIENLLNTFFELFNSHTHPVISVGSETGVSVPQQTVTLTPTKRADIENTKIKQ